MPEVDVVVIGAGQAGLSAGYHLRRRRFVPADRATAGDRTFVMVDGEDRPGGAWRHRWESLTMATVNGIFGLPGAPVPEVDPGAPSRVVLPAYFADYEERFSLGVRRPVRVRQVRRAPDEQGGPGRGRLVVATSGVPGERAGGDGARGHDDEVWHARYVINATGTWTRPFWPYYPGRESFRGRQLHVRDYVRAEEFAGQRVVIVGSGISATQLLEEISRGADTLWVTRREIEWATGPPPENFSAAISAVAERTATGLPPESVIRVTGMYRTPWIDRAEARGALVRHPMFTRIEPDGVRMPDGRLEPADAILWATGFRPAVAHLAPLGLRTPAGGIRVADGRALDEPRLFLIGYGPSQSTVGANRAGRDAVRAIVSEL
ncbi:MULTISPECIES: NAD(P)-binding domain-containing protein [unclassified Dietzia]|uniref:NAD(P)-binding domain-containing protein n=1 Tax=unclassified Dietzia TaxID=2617939 RepID=UPI000D201A6D|nr:MULTISPECIES: NAD(P)-binding domain-containing protein [unclassified Dietzia]AVZ41070.1 pyridine nucleotide-disulfide oxidoreductase [Dietzia sp. JS16-p6b]